MAQRLSPKQKKMLQAVDDELIRAWRICKREADKETDPEKKMHWTGWADGLVYALEATDRLQANIRGKGVMDAKSNLEWRLRLRK